MTCPQNIITRLAHKIGLDKSIAYSSGARIIQGLTGVISVFFITTFLTGVEQGFYYTFGSLLAMQVFFELGLTGIMTQFVAHEVSHLIINENEEFEGEECYKSRLASLMHFCLKWYAVLAIVVFIFLIVIGFAYFNQYGREHVCTDWQIPWILVCVGTSVKLFQSPFTSIFMGLGKVKEMSKIGFWQQMVIPVITWLGLIIGFKLYVVGIGYLFSVVLWILYVYHTRLIRLQLNLWKNKITERVLYFKEIFPFQWRIALSWVSGYFIFQLFNPVLFATEGAVVAGQMGMTLTALNSIQALSSSWLNTKVPYYSQLIALKDYVTLDVVFNKTLKQMSSICLFLLIVFFVVIWLLNITKFELGSHVLADRFLGYLPLLLMSIPVVINQFISSWATYLRCHKKEPFLVNSIVSGCLCMGSTLYLGNMYGLYGITIGYCLITIFMCPWGYWIYYINKKKWHHE